ncbi:MAG: hypothetical protein WAU39_09610 [Polyangiales bacterium]
MSTLFKVMAVAAIALFDAVPVDAADCVCDHLSAEGCRDGGGAYEGEPAAPPQWCERMDDPRCMPASPHSTSVQTVVPAAVGWTQSIRWGGPPRQGVPVDARIDGGARMEHSRRVERPPR